jgi:hypothetical protein
VYQAQLLLAKCWKAEGDWKAGISACNAAIASYSKERANLNNRLLITEFKGILPRYF